MLCFSPCVFYLFLVNNVTFSPCIFHLQLVLGFCLFICGIVAIAASIPCDGECQSPCTAYEALQSVMRYLALFGLIPGLLTLMFGGLGVAGATKRSKCMVGAHLGVTILVFILCIVGAIVTFWTSVCVLNCFLLPTS
jgi:uncharacterized membrane protein